MNVYRIDVRLVATAYVKADSEEAALAKLATIAGTSDATHPDSELPISGADFHSKDLPDVSISPAFTLTGPLEGAESIECVEWSGEPDPADPDNIWIDDSTGDRVSAVTGERSAV